MIVTRSTVPLRDIRVGRLVNEGPPEQTASLQVCGGKFRDLPSSVRLELSLIDGAQGLTLDCEIFEKDLIDAIDNATRQGL